MNEHLTIVLLAAACSAAVGVVAVLVRPLLARASLRHAFVAVALVALLGCVTGLLAAANAMLLSDGDFEVVSVVAGVTGVASLGFAMVLARPVIRGTEQLRDAARELGVRGSYTAPPDLPTRELRALSAELDQASERLDEARDHERTLTQARTELIAWISHDLRTPLAGMRAMAESLEDGLATEPERYHQQIRAEVDKMADLVNDLLELSRINTAGLHLEIAPIGVADLVSDALAAAEPLASNRSLRLTGRAEPGLQIDADARELGRVITNLLDNAIRHTGTNGQIAITGHGEGQEAVISVTDECGGIPEEQLDRVFDPAWRGTAARTPDGEAHPGLGLTIVHSIVGAHGGRVSVDNTGPGCRFQVRLPRGPAHREVASP